MTQPPGGTLSDARSQLHYDKENIVLCTVRGIKHFVLVETRKFYHDIPWVRGGRSALDFAQSGRRPRAAAS